MVTVGYNPSTGKALMGTGGALCIGCCGNIGNPCGGNPMPAWIDVTITNSDFPITPGDWKDPAVFDRTIRLNQTASPSNYTGSLSLGSCTAKYFKANASGGFPEYYANTLYLALTVGCSGSPRTFNLSYTFDYDVIFSSGGSCTPMGTPYAFCDSASLSVPDWPAMSSVTGMSWPGNVCAYPANYGLLGDTSAGHDYDVEFNS